MKAVLVLLIAIFFNTILDFGTISAPTTKKAALEGSLATLISLGLISYGPLSSIDAVSYTHLRAHET